MADQPDSILVVDDDVALAKVLCALLAQAGHRATMVGDAAAALAVLEQGGTDLVLTDVRMPGMDGFGLLAAVREKYPEIPVVLITAHGSVPMAVDAMRAGAANFVLKPFEREDLLHVLRQALAESSPERRAVPARPGAAGDGGLFGTTPAMREVQSLIARVASSTTTVLLRGENGTGKEVAARSIHRQSPRAKGPFVAVNCAALPETLLESELFGYDKGAFTGASPNGKPGRVEVAEGGTLLLDEIGDITPATQVKLLRLLQEKTYERVCGVTTRKADVRFLVATHRNLEEMVKAGQFREDLFYRLNVVPIRLPPLRERKEDIGPLARTFCATFAKENGRPSLALDASAIAKLEAESWPGNVRQLQNFVERLVVLAPGETLTADDVVRELGRDAPLGAAAPAPDAAQGSLEDHRKDAERAAVVDALARARNNRTVAARLLGVSRRTLYNKLEALGLDQQPAA